MACRFALIGCGGMGRRHLRGFAELNEVRPGLAEVAAVVDISEEHAEFAANEAEELLGTRPVVCSSIEAAHTEVPDLDAVDIVTIASTHHDIAVTALDLGLHVLMEKPLGVTIRACDLVAEAAHRTGLVVSVAENYRRDPVSRLGRALLDSGAIGRPDTVLEIFHGGGDTVMITPWRHLREEGGPLMDMGVHMADMLLYLIGPVEEAFGLARIAEPERVAAGGRVGSPGGFYDRFQDEFPETVEATAPDSVVGTLSFESGAWGQWVMATAARGPGAGPIVRTILGSEGRMDMPHCRNGQPLQVWRGDSRDLVRQEELLALVPDFSLDRLTADLFGGDRLAQYELDFAASDRKLLALEIGELAEAVAAGDPVEVGIEAGTAGVAFVLAVLESSEAGRKVSMSEIRDGVLNAYQDPTDRKLGLLT